MQPDVRALIKPAIQLILEIELVGERPARLKARLHEPLQPLDHALRLAISGIEDPPADRHLPAERGELLGRPPATGVQAPLAIDHQALGQRTEPPHAPPHPPQHVRRLLGEHQRPRAEPRETERADNHVPLARLPIADRDLPLRLPQIELGHVPRPVDRALIGPLIQEERTHLPHIIVGDRLAALEPLLDQELADPLALHLRISPQQRVDLVPERVELRPAGRPRIRRRLIASATPCGSCSRCSPVRRAELPDRQPLARNASRRTGPLLHADQPLLLTRSTIDRARLGTPPDGSAPATGGQFSTGEGGPVFSRRRQKRTSTAAWRRSMQAAVRTAAGGTATVAAGRGIPAGSFYTFGTREGHVPRIIVMADSATDTVMLSEPDRRC